MYVFEVPVLESERMHVFPVWEQLTTAALTLAELVNVPNRPNTNPAMAMAAMRVMAMRITVASTGLIAFLDLLEIFIAVTPYETVPVYGTDAELLRRMLPTICAPLAGIPVSAGVVLPVKVMVHVELDPATRFVALKPATPTW